MDRIEHKDVWLSVAPAASTKSAMDGEPAAPSHAGREIRRMRKLV